MKKFSLFLVFLALAVSPARADVVKTVHLEKGDSLGALLDSDVPSDSLVISGWMDRQSFVDLGLYCKEAGPRGVNLYDVEAENDSLPREAFGFNYRWGLPHFEGEKPIGLEYITLPKGLKHIGKCAFADLRGLKDVSIPPSVVDIDLLAFTRIDSMKTVVLPTGLERIGDGAFYICESLSGIVLPEGLKEIGEEAFSVTGLKEVAIPESVVKLGRIAFGSSKSLAKVVLPRSMAAIPQFCFRNTSVSEVTWPDSLETICDYAFDLCDFTTLDLPEGLRTIKYSAFASNECLQTVKLPSTLELIYSDAFAKCGKLEYMECHSLTPPSIEGNEDPYRKASWHTGVVLYVPEEAMDAYLQHPFWSKFKEIRPLTANGIGSTRPAALEPQQRYDLQGRRLSGGPAGGIYIQDGRKKAVGRR